MSLRSENRRDSEVIGLSEVFATLWARRWVTVIVFAIVTSGFTVAAYVIEPVYRASVVLLPATTERGSLSSSLNSTLGSLSGLASLAGVGVGSADSATEEALAVLRSRQFTEAFIIDNNLMPKLYRKKWDAESSRWRVRFGEQPTGAKACKLFDTDIRTIIQDRKTGLVILQIDWRDRNDAAHWANELVQRLNAEMRFRAIAKADASISYLEKELAKTSVVGTRDAIDRLIEAEIRQRMLADVNPDYVFRIVDRALAPDANDPIIPKKLQLIVGGAVIGLSFGILLAFLLGAPTAVSNISRT